MRIANICESCEISDSINPIKDCDTTIIVKWNSICRSYNISIESAFQYFSHSLQEYVDLEDDAYSWTDTGHRLRVDPAASGRGGWTGYFLNFTSQQWLTPQLVSRSLWWHTLVVIVPDNLTTTDATIMWMTGNLSCLTNLCIYFAQTVTTRMTLHRISLTTICWLPEKLLQPMGL